MHIAPLLAKRASPAGEPTRIPVESDVANLAVTSRQPPLVPTLSLLLVVSLLAYRLTAPRSGGALDILFAPLLRSVGDLGLVVALPFLWLVYNSYRLHLARMAERQARLRDVETLNGQLAAKVDELIRANSFLQQANQRHVETSRLKSAFVASVSHELRTPLNAIIGFSEMLHRDLETQLRPRQLDALQDIHGSGRDLLALIDDLLDLSKIEAGKMALRLEECAPAEIIRDVMAMVGVLALKKSIELDFDDDTTPISMRADSVHLRQILWNLLSNAIKFTPTGGKVGVRLRENNDIVRIAVWDTGIGIAHEEQERLFDEFYQIDGGHRREHGGTGLGLALVRRFVQLHGGRIEVRSDLGHGARFEVRLPRLGVAPHDNGQTHPETSGEEAGLEATTADDDLGVELVGQHA